MILIRNQNVFGIFFFCYWCIFLMVMKIFLNIIIDIYYIWHPCFPYTTQASIHSYLFCIYPSIQSNIKMLIYSYDFLCLLCLSLSHSRFIWKNTEIRKKSMQSVCIIPLSFLPIYWINRKKLVRLVCYISVSNLIVVYMYICVY